MVDQNLHWQLPGVTLMDPSDDETVHLPVPASPVIATFSLSTSCFERKSEAYGVSKPAYCTCGESCGRAVTLFTTAMSVAWSLSFRRQARTMKNWSKNVDKLTYLQQTTSCKSERSSANYVNFIDSHTWSKHSSPWHSYSQVGWWSSLPG